jgi:hypothetical protein
MCIICMLEWNISTVNSECNQIFQASQSMEKNKHWQPTILKILMDMNTMKTILNKFRLVSSNIFNDHVQTRIPSCWAGIYAECTHFSGHFDVSYMLIGLLQVPQFIQEIIIMWKILCHRI